MKALQLIYNYVVLIQVYVTIFYKSTNRNYRRQNNDKVKKEVSKKERIRTESQRQLRSIGRSGGGLAVKGTE